MQSGRAPSAKTLPPVPARTAKRPRQKLLAGDKSIQAAVKEIQKDGVIIKVCKACADSYGVSEHIRDVGVEVKYMGRPLTEMLKSDYKVLTF